MQQNGYAFTYTSYEHFKGTKENIQNQVQIPKSLNYNQALKGNQIGCLTVMLDRKQIPNIQESLALYRTGNSKSISGNKIQSALWTWKVYKESQEFSMLKSAYYMLFYVMNGLRKHS